MSKNIDLLNWIQNWFYSNCNGDWEHNRNIVIENLDNNIPSSPPGSQLANPTQTPGETQNIASSSEKVITSFRFLLSPEVVGLLDQANHTVTLTVPYGTDVKNLVASVAVSPDATVDPVQNTAQDFTNSVIYRVTAQDGSIQSYRVIVNVLPEVVKEFTLFGFNVTAIATFLAIVAVIAIIFAVVMRKKGQKQKIKQQV